MTHEEHVDIHAAEHGLIGRVLEACDDVVALLRSARQGSRGYPGPGSETRGRSGS